MDVLIVGAGAIGSLLAYRLAIAGHQVTAVGRAPFAQAVAQRGLLIEQDKHVAIAPQFNYGLCEIECQTSPADPYPASRRGLLPVIGLNPPRLRSID